MKHTTPLRYPGGKQKLTPFIREVLFVNNLLGGEYIEPYAGGAGVAINLLLEGSVSNVHLNDSCRRIYSIWWSILNEPVAFCRKIRSASLTVDEWRRQKEILKRNDTEDLLELGFSAFYLNRVNRSGILTGGLIGGISQTGKWNMNARFPRNELIRRVEIIAAKKNCISIYNSDAEIFISELNSIPVKSLIYFDPPYYRKADRLYLNHYSSSDHARLAQTIQNQVKLPWLVSYDNAEEIRNLYSERRGFTYHLKYNAAKCYQGSEYFAFSDCLKIPKSSQLPFIQTGLDQVLV